MKRTTTVRLPDSLLALAKKTARAEGITLTALIEESLLQRVRRRPKRVERVLPPISSVRGYLLEGVDLSRSAEVQEILDEDVIREAGLIKLR